MADSHASKSRLDVLAHAASAWIICVLPLATIERLRFPQGGSSQQLLVIALGGTLASLLLSRWLDSEQPMWVPSIRGLAIGVLVFICMLLTETLVDSASPRIVSMSLSAAYWSLLALSLFCAGAWLAGGIGRLYRRHRCLGFVAAAAMLTALMAWPMPTESLSENQMGALALVIDSWGLGAGLLAAITLASWTRARQLSVGG